MKRSWQILLILIIALPALGAVAGRLAAPGLARFNYLVRLAGHVRQDELKTQHAEQNALPSPTVGKTAADLEVKAFKTTGLPPASLYAQAQEVRRKFATGATWFGVWCGLIAAIKIITMLGWRRQREYDADPAHCLACARCYLACPVERERLQAALGERPL